MGTRQELLRAVRERYAGKSRGEKSRILEEFVAVTGYHRKHEAKPIWKMIFDPEVDDVDRGRIVRISSALRVETRLTVGAGLP